MISDYQLDGEAVAKIRTGGFYTETDCGVVNYQLKPEECWCEEHHHLLTVKEGQTND
jgi:hypothetical protein